MGCRILREITPRWRLSHRMTPVDIHHFWRIALAYRVPCISLRGLWETDVLFLATKKNSHTLSGHTGHKRQKTEFLFCELSFSECPCWWFFTQQQGDSPAAVKLFWGFFFSFFQFLYMDSLNGFATCCEQFQRNRSEFIYMCCVLSHYEALS